MSGGRELTTDDLILDCIKNRYKSCSQIASELDLNKHRIHIRMKSLRKFRLVTFVNNKNIRIKQDGQAPTLYKKSIN